MSIGIETQIMDFFEINVVKKESAGQQDIQEGDTLIFKDHSSLTVTDEFLSDIANLTQTLQDKTPDIKLSVLPCDEPNGFKGHVVLAQKPVSYYGAQVMESGLFLIDSEQENAPKQPSTTKKEHSDQDIVDRLNAQEKILDEFEKGTLTQDTIQTYLDVIEQKE